VGVLVIDTDIASLIWRDALPDELDQQLLGRISLITFVTLGEALTGAHSGGWNPRRSSGLRAFYEHAFTLLEWDDAIPYIYARLRGQAAISGHTVPANDCWIAACCVTHDLPLMTRNRKHFEPLEPLGLDLL
jgi:toxin FitB